MKKEWKEWLESPVEVVRVDRRRKTIQADRAPPPAWLYRWILLKRLHDTPRCVEILSALAKEGCDGRVLLKHLEDIIYSRRMDRWKKLAGGLRPREIKAATKRMRKCAREIEALNSGYASKEYFAAFPDCAPLRALPAGLRTLAGIWEWLPRRLRRVKPDSRARLMEHVVEQTAKPHYEEMAALIGAAEDSQIDAVALRMWCSKQGLTKKSSKAAGTK
jgi:hypothetical protein